MTDNELCPLCTWSGGNVGAHLARKHGSLSEDERLIATLRARTGPPDPDTGCTEFTRARNPAGYGVLMLGDATYLAHRVALGVHRAPPTLKALHHCDNPPCVARAHLYPGSPADNTRGIAERGGFEAHAHVGSGHPLAKLTEDGARAIWERIQTGEESYRAIAEDFPVGSGLVGCIARGEAWTHVTGLQRQRGHAARSPARGAPPAGRRLSREAVLDIDRRLAAGERQVDVAAEHGVTQACVSDIKRGVTWAAVTGRSHA